MKYSDIQRIHKIYELAEKLLLYIKEKQITKEALLNDFAIQWLVTTPMYNIGEHAYNLSDEFKENYSDIPWAMISGLRHRLVHDYEGTNWNIISDVILLELPELVIQLDHIINKN